MALIDDLIDKIGDSALRDRVRGEVNKLNKNKKFGLVFEDHVPEFTPLYEVEIRKGSKVALKDKRTKKIYTVLEIIDAEAICLNETVAETVTFRLDELVQIAEFGEPIYPYLEKINSIENAPNNDLWHLLIEADNYHALQLLEYVYGGKVDCIYIDPPYNTRAKDWKYNNDYVDPTDAFKHSKWLSMMDKRLRLAKKLLNPDDSVLIVTIDEKEVHHLGLLLENLFPEAKIQMISSVINPKGSARYGFSRSDEYIMFVMLGNSRPTRLPLGNEWASSAIKSKKSDKKIDSESKKKKEPGWTSMMRRGTDSLRSDVPSLFYPIYVDPESKKIKKIGEVIPEGYDKGEDIAGLVQVLPIRKNRNQGRWQVGPTELKNRIEQGRIRLGGKTHYGYVINYLADGEYNKVLEGLYEIVGYADDGSMIAYESSDESSKYRTPPTQWRIASHDATEYGTNLLTNILGEKRFTFPKSLYAVLDTIRFFVANKPNAIVLDFFAGSGTTAHAVNLLNADDNGNRQCIMVTNNEVSDTEAKKLSKAGYQPGDIEWESLGIARYVTWPRTVCSIEGKDSKSNSIEGKYYGREYDISKGFESNVAYFKLGFLNKDEVALGRQFKELVPVLWMKAGSKGRCPDITGEKLRPAYIFPKNDFAILVNENRFLDFKLGLEKFPNVKTVFIVTDSEEGFAEMASQLDVSLTCQLYRDYLDNFRINTGGV